MLRQRDYVILITIDFIKIDNIAMIISETFFLTGTYLFYREMGHIFLFIFTILISVLFFINNVNIEGQRHENFLLL
jgi:hypothetical protein